MDVRYTVPVTLVVAGYRAQYDGRPYGAGSVGGYWSSEASGVLGPSLYFDSTVAMPRRYVDSKKSATAGMLRIILQ